MNRTPYIAPEQREGYNAPIIDVNAGEKKKSAPRSPATPKAPAKATPAKRKAK